MALLLHNESASLISGALAQSGPSAVNFVNGDMDKEVSRKRTTLIRMVKIKNNFLDLAKMKIHGLLSHVVKI